MNYTNQVNLFHEIICKDEYNTLVNYAPEKEYYILNELGDKIPMNRDFVIVNILNHNTTSREITNIIKSLPENCKPIIWDSQYFTSGASNLPYPMRSLDDNKLFQDLFELNIGELIKHKDGILMLECLLLYFQFVYGSKASYIINQNSYLGKLFESGFQTTVKFAKYGDNYIYDDRMFGFGNRDTVNTYYLLLRLQSYIIKVIAENFELDFENQFSLIIREEKKLI